MENMYSFSEELEADKLSNSPWFFILLGGFACGIILVTGNFKPQIETILIALFAGLSSIGTLLSLVKTKILLEYDNLILDRSLFSKHFTRKYEIQGIKNLKYERNVKSNVYTSNGSIRVLGVDLTPESWKDYYYHKEVLSFDYKGHRIEIGKWKREFNGKRLYELLKEKVI